MGTCHSGAAGWAIQVQRGYQTGECLPGSGQVGDSLWQTQSTWDENGGFLVGEGCWVGMEGYLGFQEICAGMLLKAELSSKGLRQKQSLLLLCPRL